jgi:hypothetical protein
MAAPHPLSAKMAVATVKRYLVDPSAKIRLRDLVHEETEKLVAALTEQAFPGQASQEHPKELLRRVRRYDSLTEILLSVYVAGSYWGDQQHVKFWTGSLQRVVNTSNQGGGLVYLIKLRQYPALVLFYAAGIAAVASGHYDSLAALFMQPKTKESGKDIPIVSALSPGAVMEDNIGHMLPGLDRRRTPLSDYIFERLREPLREYLAGDEEYQSAFDRFEYLLGLIYADIVRRDYQGAWVGPVGCFSWRRRDFGENYMPAIIKKEFEAEGANWPPLKAGLLGGSIEQAKTAINNFNLLMGKLGYF